LSCLGKIDERAAVPVRHPIIGQTIGNLIASGEQQASQDPPAKVVNADGSIDYYGTDAIPHNLFAGPGASGPDASTTVGEIVVTARRGFWGDLLHGNFGNLGADISHDFSGGRFFGVSGGSAGVDGTYSNYFYYQPPTASEMRQTQIERQQAAVNALPFENDPVTKAFVAIPLAAAAAPLALEYGGAALSAPVIKAVGGFGLGYGGAALTGVQSTQGRVFAGLVGAVAAPGGSAITDFAGAAATRTFGSSVAGAAASFGTGGVLAYGAGAGGEAAGEYGDGTPLNPNKINEAGLVTGGAYLLFGEGALTAAGGYGLVPEGVGGTAAGLAVSADTSAGALALQKLLDARNGR
jgi:hypothetical protein